MSRSFVCSAVVFALSAIGPTAADGLHFASTGVSYDINASRVAVFAEDGARAAASLRALPGVESVEPHAVAGWQIVTLEAPALDSRSLETAIDTIANASGVRFASPVAFDTLGGTMFVHQKIMVKLAPGLRTDAEAVFTGYGELDVVETNYGMDADVLMLRSTLRDGADVLELANELTSDPRVLWAEPDVTFTGIGALTPNDPNFNDLWGIRNIGQFSGALFDFDMDGSEAWDITTGDNSIVTVIIDTGVQQDHPDINQRAGIDFTSDNGNGGPINQWDNHGTAVASCVSSTINNNIGVVGLAPTTRTASARAFISINSSGSWTSNSSWTVNTLTWAQGINARVTNNSNMYGFTSAAIQNTYSSTRNAGIVHFASAGNDSSTSIGYPSSLSSVISVAASHFDGVLASFSTRGPGIGITAPGQTIRVSDRTGSAGYSGGDIAWVQGTSFASPYTAAVAALVLSVDDTLSASQVEQILFNTSIDLGASGYDTTYGWGHVNALAAVQEASPQGSCGWDVNNSGAVDIEDLLQVLREFAVSAGGDTDGDNDTDIEDLLAVLREFGRSCP